MITIDCQSAPEVTFDERKMVRFEFSDIRDAIGTAILLMNDPEIGGVQITWTK
jgi:hypothetical protein